MSKPLKWEQATNVREYELAGLRFIHMECEPCPPPERLTATEAEVAKLALQGLSRAQIAQQRRVGIPTVTKQLCAIYRKFEVSSRSELIALFTAHPPSHK